MTWPAYCVANSSASIAAAGQRRSRVDAPDNGNARNNGEITDPPATEFTSSVQYAHFIPRAASPVFSSTDETLFCPTCLQNQLVLTKALASYLPPPDDLSYATYEASYPSYRRSLEERYPQVCADCEPRVRDRIRQTGYAAKTDHLRRMMERTRGTSGNYGLSGWAWRDAVVLFGAVGWWGSLAGQTLWDLFGALERMEHDGLRDDQSSTTLRMCIDHCLSGSTLDEGCAASAQPLAGLALLLGIVSFWWNNRLREKVQGSGGRLIGLTEYYKTQFVVLVSTIISLWMVKIDHSPRVSFQETCEPLVSQDRSKSRTHSRSEDRKSAATRSSQFNAQSASFIQPFPINNLAPVRPTTYQASHDALTPPPDFSSADAMDWTPSQPTFNPAPPNSRSQALIAPAEPSPFYGRLPPAPASRNRQLRNPQNQTIFRKTSAAKQQNFFNNLTRRSTLKSEENEQQDRDTPVEFAPSRLVLAEDSRTDTGLESLFDAAFSLGDEPKEVRIARERQHHQHSERRAARTSKLKHVSSVCLAGLSLMSWKLAKVQPLFATQLRLGAACMVALLAGQALFTSLPRGRAGFKSREGFTLTLEMLGMLVVTLAVWSGALHRDTGDTLGTILLGAMVIQELWSLDLIAFSAH
ncbi:MAG: hypothetical protein M1827_002930 [Pycnora praestabilis]|nr:MAG: hypothetical protein M1827_002930 [Pycnora praestabilis]